MVVNKTPASMSRIRTEINGTEVTGVTPKSEFIEKLVPNANTNNPKM